MVPLRCDLLAARALVTELHRVPADDALGVEDESQAVGVGLVAQVDEQVVLRLQHAFEGKPLVKDYVHNTLLGLEFLWGGKVQLETTEVKAIRKPDTKQPTLPGLAPTVEAPEEAEIQWQRVRYTMKDRKLSRGLV